MPPSVLFIIRQQLQGTPYMDSQYTEPQVGTPIEVF